MEEKRLVPKRRNSKYSGVWIEKEFNDLGNFGKIYPFSRSEEGTGRFHHIHYGDIHTKSFGIVDNSSELPKIKVEGSFELAKPGDIVIADASEDYKDLGKSVVIGANTNRQIIAGLHTFKFTPNEQLCPLYYLYYSQTRIFKKFSYKTGTGISVFGMSKDNLGKMKLYIPTIEEQQKIGEFFKTLDERIANQERKIAKGKALKAAYLNEMFPQEGEAVPKRRFKEFQGKWKDISLEEALDYEQPNSYIVDEEDYSDKFTTPVLTAGQSFLLGFTQETHGIKNASLDNPVVIFDDFTTSSHFVDFSFKVKSSALKILIPDKNKYNSYFLYQVLKNIDYKPKNHERHWISIFSSFTVKVPAKSEQKKIGEFFKNLDDQIATEEKKLAKLKKMKEAYLEEMFV